MSAIEQAIARRALVKVMHALKTPGEPDPYVEASDRTVLGETEHATIMAPRPGTEDYWEPFNHRIPEHWDAWKKTYATGRIAFLDLDSGDVS